MHLNPKGASQGKAVLQVSSREHFNYLRNNSNLMGGAMSWGSSASCKCSAAPPNQVTFGRSDNGSPEKRQGSVALQKMQPVVPEPVPKQKGVSFKDKRAVSASTHQGQRLKKELNHEEMEDAKRKDAQNREKVDNYIESLIPYSRTLPNSQFQDYFKKSAMECYGRANNKNATGGTVYGNDLKTFNINPHIGQNQPKFYETHHTAINFAKRTKLSDEEKYQKLQRTLTKKLNLNAKNETLKEGKDIVYVDVDDETMYSTMKENHEFSKQYNKEIRQTEKQYEKDKMDQRLAAIDQFYADKKHKIETNLANTAGDTIDRSRVSQRINEQVVYRHKDEEGNTRYAGDRHAVTCFVDLNFPENEPIYTQELRNRLPIYKEAVKDKDRDINQTRRKNYKEDKQYNVYPSHYLVPAVQQPEVKNMLMNKTPSAAQPKTGISGKSFVSAKSTQA